MSLTPGTRLGPYELLAQLGAGGMGEVYRAKDARLGRTVAIKVLPPDAATDASARARFEREARAIAALSHPHICVVHDVGREGDTDYLVMELLEGETLFDRLAKVKGPLPLAEVLSIGVAIADALDKAHRAGIVHRDLKPANVMLTKSGPKLLDFGLAKRHAAFSQGRTTETTAVRMVGEAPDASAPSTATNSPLTGEGTILGSLHYMSPEQVDGREVDARADIWALGTLLYEMATGTRPFEGASPASVLGAILKDTPAPLAAREPLTPPAFAHLVERCLEKDPDDRWQSVRDVKRELGWIAANVSSGSGSLSGSTTNNSTAHTALPYSSGFLRAALVVMSVAALALAWPAMKHISERPRQPAEELRLDIATPSTADQTSFALSPDGKSIVFAATSSQGAPQLWLRSLASTDAQVVPGTEGASFPFWSPDGRSIGFFAVGLLKRVDLNGGPARTIASAPGGRGGTWSLDGTILFAPTSAGVLLRVPASGGQTAAVTTLDRQQTHRFPEFLPDGRHFLFYAQGGPETGGIHIGVLGQSGARRLTNATAAGAFLPPNWLLWERDGSLVAQRLNQADDTLAGDVVSIATGITVDTAFNHLALSTTPTGMLAYRAGTPAERQLTWVDRGGRVLGTLGPPDSSDLRGPRVSPDGSRAVVSRTVQGNTDIWTIDANRRTRLTFNGARDLYPIWSPDGRQVAFGSDRNGARDIFLTRADGSGEERLLITSPIPKTVQDWSRDGAMMTLVNTDSKTGRDLLAWRVGGQDEQLVIRRTPFEERQGQFSPNGRFVAFESNESGRDEIYINALAGGADGAAGAARRWQVSTTGGVHPRWRNDGGELYYLDPDGRMMAALLSFSGEELTVSAPVALFGTSLYGGGADTGLGGQYDVSRDGRFLLNSIVERIPPPITLLLNWQAETKP